MYPKWHVTHMFRTMRRIVYASVSIVFIDKFMHNHRHGILRQFIQNVLEYLILVVVGR